MQPHQQPSRYRGETDYKRHTPVHVVWEITLACDLKCQHCGSRAGPRRAKELSTEECVEVIRSLERMGTREITLIGGEAYLRKDWTTLVREIRSRGIDCYLQTGGRNLTQERIAAAVEAGLQGVGVSLDGMRALHDRLRGVPGSFERALDSLRRCREAGLGISVNTQIGAETMADLPELMDTLIGVGATHWQIQLTVAMGNAVDNDSLLLQPYQVLELMPLLARLYREGLKRGLLMIVGNNIGFFGPYEHMWRGYGDERMHWNGCSAGQTGMGLEADGSVKGCPSLPTVGYTGGNVRDLKLEDIWSQAPEIHFGRLRTVEDLWGYCRTCYYADVCRGGCTWTSHSLFGRPGNNPYCHYRALELEKRGLRERVVKKREAPQASFAIGEFELVVEPIAGREAEAQQALEAYGSTEVPPRRMLEGPSPEEGRVPPRMELCRACNCYIHAHETRCPHCSADVAQAAAQHAEDVRRRRAVMAEVQRLIDLARSQASS